MKTQFHQTLKDSQWSNWLLQPADMLFPPSHMGWSKNVSNRLWLMEFICQMDWMWATVVSEQVVFRLPTPSLYFELYISISQLSHQGTRFSRKFNCHKISFFWQMILSGLVLTVQRRLHNKPLLRKQLKTSLLGCMKINN